MKNKILTILSIFVLLFNFSCSDLEEEILDESLSGGAKNVDLAASAIGPAYAGLPELYKHTKYFALQEVASDEAILPARGGKDWFDGGIYVELNSHTYTSNTGSFGGVWNDLTKLLSKTVSAIAVLEPLAEENEVAKVYLAEANALYAFYNWMFLDLWGVAFQKDDAGEMSKVLHGDEAIKFIASKYEKALPHLATNVGSGRLNVAAVKGLLARLYLNAAVYRDPYATTFNFTNEDMDKVIQYTSEVISMTQYSLSAEYFDLFGNDNYNNPELLWAIDQRPDLNGHNRLAYFSMSRGFYGNANSHTGYGTDAIAVTSDFYQIWENAYDVDPAEADSRFYWQRIPITEDMCVAKSEYRNNRGIYRGKQIGLLNTGHKTPFVECPDHPGHIKLGVLTHSKMGYAEVNFTKNVDYSPEGSGYNNGYRVLKYDWSSESEDGRKQGMADLVVIRLADIYLMRAEAKLRKGASGALEDVNMVRTARTARVTPVALSSVDLELLYRERGFEFYFEHMRRTDMIRFGHYEDGWTEKTNSDPKKRLFPIPQTAIDAASSEEGYLVQNEGY